jgi:type I restriction-modification system modification subunit
MITGHIKNQIDQIWDTFWTGGISNSIDILEQMTYLFFMKLLDDKQLNQEATAAIIGQKVSDPTLGEGLWHQTVSQDIFSLLSQN